MTIQIPSSDQGIKPSPTASLADLADYRLDYSLWDPSNPSSTEETRRRFVNSLRSAATLGLGFFYLSNTPLEGDRRRHLFSRTRAFFQETSLEDKLSIEMARSRHFRGYTAVGDEMTLGRKDERDQIDFGYDLDTYLDRRRAAVGREESGQKQEWEEEEESLISEWRSDPELEKLSFLNLVGPNQYPSEEGHPNLVGFKDSVRDWSTTCEELVVQLTKALEEALGVESGRLVRTLKGEDDQDQVGDRVGGESELDPSRTAIKRLGPLPFCRMKVIRYPPISDPTTTNNNSNNNDSDQGVGPHKDSGWITLLATSDVAGLEVQDFKGNWIDVPHIDGEMVVNFGQQIEYQTRGLVQAACHRVVRRQDSKSRTRYSIPYFSFPALNAKLRPLSEKELKPLLDLWSETEEEGNHQREDRHREGIIVSDVPKGDLYADADDHFGWVAWKGLVRSHPKVVENFYRAIG
ncbi:Clavaminate synthase-like protein [Violaceomyces palustris]|uniref:Clavaminate synthase-like protein n=1 Tax=Violaceomyces palustris TaxID=1673888 RepID=A0ACD0NSH9_9BASI|nr:Clavaminate synthase-like protein [Violaceomyces palustris]